MGNMAVNGVDLHYWTVGEGPDIVMMHGLGGNLAIWHMHVVPHLRDKFRLTSFDFRGHGKSSMPASGYSTGGMVKDLLGLMDALGIEKAHLAGHSMGADVALHFAMLHPDRAERLVVVEAGLPALVAARKDESWIGWSYWAEMIEKYTGEKVPPEHRTDYRYLLHQSLKVPILFGPSRGQSRRRQDKFVALLDTTTMVDDYEVVGELTLENIATVPHPKLLMYEQGSPYIGTYHEICEVAINYESVLLPPTKYRHFFPLEKPEVLAAHIVEFCQPEREVVNGRQLEAIV
ncbi:MAG: alpha/beta hydrolase [Chloroflexota bacterium]|nr:alpha/beta hydrolase [Chloroflexota bacterium]